MNQRFTVHKILKCINDESPDLTRQEWLIIVKYLRYAYTVGYEEGYRDRSAGGRKKAVQQIKNGMVIHIHDSASDAARFVKGDKANILKAAKDNERGKIRTVKGFQWAYK